MISSAKDDLHKTGISGRKGEEQGTHLEYLADLLGELQRIAQGCHRLSRMLAISHAEAQCETHRRSPFTP